MRIDETALICPGVVLSGNITVGARCSIWYNAVLRSTNSLIEIGDESNVQDGCVLHAKDDKIIRLGKGVTIGHNAIVHCCEIGDNTLVGMGATILSGAVIGKNCIIGANALVTGGTVIPDNSMVLGAPAKIRREVTEAEIEKNREYATSHFVEMDDEIELLKTDGGVLVKCKR